MRLSSTKEARLSIPPHLVIIPKPYEEGVLTDNNH